MALNYACFISYRHGEFETNHRFIEDFYRALSGELELLLDQKVYLDQERLKGGYFYNEALAEALCQSACMIMVFTPQYFSKEHPYCAREFKAMEYLEKERLALLNPPGGLIEGLIIPVVLRNADSLPLEIKQRRQYHDFSRFRLSERRIMHNSRYDPLIKEIAQYIYDRYNSLMAVSDQLQTECNKFTCPSEEEISTWLAQVTSSQLQEFPGRIK